MRVRREASAISRASLCNRATSLLYCCDNRAHSIFVCVLIFHSRTNPIYLHECVSISLRSTCFALWSSWFFTYHYNILISGCSNLRSTSLLPLRRPLVCVLVVWGVGFSCLATFTYLCCSHWLLSIRHYPSQGEKVRRSKD